MQTQKIVVLGTGGTIAGTLCSPGDTRYVAAQKTVAALLADLPVPTELTLLSEQVAQVDSKDMVPSVWQVLLQRCHHWLAQADVHGLVITHGTDTLEETAYLLQTVLAPAKPVVMTCAMRAADAADADGPRNLRDALTVAAQQHTHGVVVVCAGRVMAAQDVQKVHPTRLDAFDSGAAGDLGHIHQGRVVWERKWPIDPVVYDDNAIKNIVTEKNWPRVEIVFSHAGASGATVDALADPDVAVRYGAAPVRGLVLVATGNGTVHQALDAALQRAVDQGVWVLRTTRCAHGGMEASPHAVWRDAPDLSPVKARVALMLALLTRTGVMQRGVN